MTNVPTVKIAPAFVASGDDTTANQVTAGWQRDSSATGLSDGRYVVTWVSHADGTLGRVYARIFNADGTAAGSQFLVGNVSAGSQEYANVAAGVNGSFVISWAAIQYNVSNVIAAQRYDATGAPVGSEITIATLASNGNMGMSRMAPLAGGGFVVTYDAVNGYQTGEVWARIYDANGVATGAAFQVNTFTTDTQWNPKVTPLGTGFLVTWQSELQDGTNSGVYGQRFDASGAKVGGEFRVNSATAFNETGGWATELAGGGFVVTWGSYDSNGSTGSKGIFAQVYDANGAPVGGAQMLDEGADPNNQGRSARTPFITALDDGGFVVGWEANSSPSNTYSEIFVRRYDADGTPRGGFIQANMSGPSGWPQAMLTTEGGEVVIVWQAGHSTTATFSDIYFQRYSTEFSATEQTSFLVRDAITVGDDLGSNTVTVTLSVSYGQLTVNTTGSGVSANGNGTASVVLTGTVDQLNALLAGGASSKLSFFANTDAPPASATLTAQISDVENQTATSTTPIAIAAVDDAPTAHNDAASTNEATIKTGNVLADNGSGADSDVDGGPMTVSAVNGNSAAVGNQITLASGALLTVNADGTYSYDPNGKFNYLPAAGSGASNLTAQDSFTYTLNGGSTATVTVTLSGLDSNGDTLSGTPGNDNLNGGTGDDTMTGGAGHDTYTVDSLGDQVIELFGEGVDTVRTNVSGYTLGANVDNMTVLAGTAPFTGYGNVLGNRMDASAASGVAGPGTGVTLYGYDGSDQLIGSAWNDQLHGGLGVDNVQGGGGDDLVWIDTQMDVQQNEVVDGGTGYDAIIANSMPTADISSWTVTNIEEINASAVNEFYLTAAQLDALTKGAGNFYLNSTGSVSLSGTNLSGTLHLNPLGNSVYLTGVSTISGLQIIGGAGVDVITGSANNTNVSVDGGAGDDQFVGGGGHDTFYGGADNDSLNGGGGDDKLYGGTGNDTYYVDAATDQVFENAGEGTDTVNTGLASYTLGANVENLNLTGTGSTGTGNSAANVIDARGAGTANDTLNGMAGIDTLYGGGGNDRLDGGTEADAMVGGAGNDTYVVDNVGDSVTELSGEGTDKVETAIENYVLGAELENLTLLYGVISGTGNALANVLTGNSYSNILDGGAGADTMNGGPGGTDTFYVDNVGDVVMGGDSQLIYTSVDYTAAAALLAVRDPNSTNAINLTGGYNFNRLVGNAGDNILSGLGNDDRLEGGAGNDRLDGGQGGDYMFGGTGNDTYVNVDAGDVIYEYAGEGVDTVDMTTSSRTTYTLGTELENLILGAGFVSGTGNGLANVITSNAVTGTGSTLYGLGGDDTLNSSGVGEALWGGDNNDTLNGNGGNDVLRGEAGNDVMNGGTGGDAMYGGTGNDTYYVDDVNDAVFEADGEGTDTINTSLNVYSISAGIFAENLTFTGSGNFDGTGNALANAITGGNGNDRLDGGTGIDVLTGGLGNDLYIVDDTSDQAIEIDGQGTDSVQASASFTLGTGIENLTLTGSAAINGTGNGLANAITGNSGANTLNGGAGADTLQGGLGDDIYYVGNAGDVVVELVSQGVDTIRASVDYALSDNQFVETLATGDDAGTAAINLTGNNTYQKIVGNAGNNSLFGRGGDDRLEGGDGSDTLNGGTGNDVLIGGNGNDLYVITDLNDIIVEAANGGNDTVNLTLAGGGLFTLANNFENLLVQGASTEAHGNSVANTIVSTATTVGNTLYGEGGNDTLTSSALAETLYGGDGNDTLKGMGGHDTLYGGTGNDLFVFGANAGSDYVGDFVPGSDRIDLSALGFTSFSQVQAAMSESGGNTRIELGGGNAVTLAGVANASLHAGDFVLAAGMSGQSFGAVADDSRSAALAFVKLAPIGGFDAPQMTLSLDSGPPSDLWL